MEHFLPLTLSGVSPAVPGGETPALRWRWHGPGLLELCPHEPHREEWVLSAGIHGDETAPIELLAELVTELLAGRQSLAVRLLVILGNPAAMAAGRRYQQLDLNRLFGGRHQAFAAGTETERARRLEQALAAFWPGAAAVPRRHYDLHTAIRASVHSKFAVLPVRSGPYDAAMLGWLRRAGIAALVQQNGPSGTFSHYTSERFAAASCTLELGKARPFGCNELADFQDVRDALVAGLAADDAGLAALPEGAVTVYRVSQELRKESEDFRLAFADSVANFTMFSQGQLLAEDGGHRFVVQQPQEFVLFPNAGVRPGLRAGLMLVPQPFSALLE